MEDLDLCYRFREAGWLTWYEPSSVALHVKGGSAGRRSPRLVHAFHEGMSRFYDKHYAPERSAGDRHRGPLWDSRADASRSHRQRPRAGMETVTVELNEELDRSSRRYRPRRSPSAVRSRRAIVVVGAHRSGTSALARVLSLRRLRPTEARHAAPGGKQRAWFLGTGDGGRGARELPDGHRLLLG